MRKRIAYTALGFAAIALVACHKYSSIEHGRGQAEDMVATIDGVPWAAADSSQSAIISQGMVTLTGVSADGQEISIMLNDTVVGLYALNQTTASLAIYGDLDSAAANGYATNNGTDTAQAGGTVSITSVNLVNRTISGVFDFSLYRPSDSSQIDITAGVFYNIPYIEQ